MGVRTLLLATAALICGAHTVCAQDTVAPDKDTTVVVKGRKKAVTRKLDKTVYNTASNPKTESGTAQDVLQSTPGVSVSADGNLSVQGNKNVTVLIDGKPAAVMSGESRAVALQTMSGSDIASVEVITNPSAAYNANGGAIINIVLKKDRKPGARGSIRANVSDQGLWNINLSGDYTKGKLSLHGTAAYRRDGTLKFRQSDVVWRDPLTHNTGENYSDSEVFIRRVVQTASFGADYDFSETDTLNAAATYNFRRSRPYFDEFHRDSEAGILTDSYHRISNGPNQQADSSLSLTYSHQKDDTVLKLALRHSDTFTLVDKSAGSFYIYPVQPTVHDRILNKSGRRLDQATLDYARPVGAMAQLSAGLDYQSEATSINNLFAHLDPVAGTETIDPNITHRYQVIATQAAAYLTGQMTWADRWELLAGARFETITTRLDAETASSIPGADYQSLNPSLHLKYSFDAARNLTLSYSQSLQRPDPRDLNPYITYQDAQNLYTGNPNLKPQRVNAVELTYAADGKILSRSFGLFYRQSRNTVYDDRTFTDQNVFLTSKQNGGSGTSSGLTGSIDWNPLENFHLSADGGIYAVELETIDMGRPVRQSGTSGYANLSLTYTKGANDLAFDAHADSAGIFPQGTYGASQSLNFTWKRKLTDRLTFNLSASDLLDGAKKSYSTTTSTFSQRGFDHFVARRVYVGLVYKIG